MQQTKGKMGRPWWSKMVVYWFDSHISITFHSDMLPSDGKDKIIQSLNLDGLNQFLMMRGYELQSFTEEDVPHIAHKDKPEIVKRKHGIARLERELEILEKMGNRHISHSSSLTKEGAVYQTPREKDITVLKAQIEQLEKEIADLEKVANKGFQQDSMSNGHAKQHSKLQNDLNSPIGKHIFHASSGQGSLVHCFFTVKQTAAYSMSGKPTMSSSGNMSSLSSMSGMGSMSAGMPSMYGDAGNYSYGAITRIVVNLINNNRDDLRQYGNIPVVAASPNWLSGGTPSDPGGCMTHGCPQSPPIPVEVSKPAWHITLPMLSDDLQKRTGEGVTVFVLDTRPSLEQIKGAAKRAEDAGYNNPLLKTMVAEIEGQHPTIIMNDQDQALPALLEDDNPDLPITGRDIWGRLSGFEMTDHGLFVAGIIRDVAPGAKIECIRALNDYGVGTVAVLTQALEDIHNRMLETNPDTGQPGDLYNRPVVINLSLVTIPHQEEIVSLWSGGAISDPVRKTLDTEPLTTHIQTVIQSLTALGAVVVGSVGNDSDLRQRVKQGKETKVVISSQRMMPRYPAAFPEVIAVGAVNKNGNATAYSNFPVAPGSTQHNGVATYGGDVYTPVMPTGNPCDEDHKECTELCKDCNTSVDTSNIDALVGVYTSSCYPSVSADDEPGNYKVPNDHGWAYWSGTSFSTPIVSGVAARVLEELVKSSHLQPYQWHNEVMRAFTNARGQKERLTGEESLPLQEEFSQGGVHIGWLGVEQSYATKVGASSSKSVSSVG